MRLFIHSVPLLPRPTSVSFKEQERVAREKRELREIRKRQTLGYVDEESVEVDALAAAVDRIVHGPEGQQSLATTQETGAKSVKPEVDAVFCDRVRCVSHRPRLTPPPNLSPLAPLGPSGALTPTGHHGDPRATHAAVMPRRSCE